MDVTPLGELVEEQLAVAHQANSGRSSHTLYGGREHSLRQTIIALTAGQELAEHANPGQATLQVLRGAVRLTALEQEAELKTGEHVAIPDAWHALAAIEDSVVLLTVVSPRA